MQRQFNLPGVLLQSSEGTVRVFPAVPADWQDMSFENLWAEAAYLVSARMERGGVVWISVLAEKGGMLRILNPKTGQVEEHPMRAGQAVEVVGQ